MKRSWIIGGSILVAWGIGAIACGSSTNSTSATDISTGSETSTTTSTHSSSTTSTSTMSGSGGMTSSSSTSTTSTGGAGGMGQGGGGGTGNCSKPTTLHPPKADAGPGTIFCPFSGVDGGKNDYCVPQTEKCCETPKGAPMPSACVDINQMCNAKGDTEWICEDPVADCKQGEVCCSNVGATLVLGGMVGGMQCGNYASKMNGTSCQAAATCPAGSIQMCTSDGECPNGQKCTPFAKAGNQVGGCM